VPSWGPRALRQPVPRPAQLKWLRSRVPDDTAPIHERVPEPTPRTFCPFAHGLFAPRRCRTALYNWLWARKLGGTFVLAYRRHRSRAQHRAKRERDLRVHALARARLDEGPDLGGKSKGDCGPYFQTQRVDIYAKYVDKLIEKGAAYRCYCTKEEMAAARTAHKAATGAEHGFRYPGTCRNRTDAPNLPSVVRLRAPSEGATGFDDLVKGHIEVPNDTLQDAVLMRNDGIRSTTWAPPSTTSPWASRSSHAATTT